MIHAEALAEIDRPVEEVFDFVSDARNEPKWDADVLESVGHSDGQIGRGSSFRWALAFMGGPPVEATATVTGFDKNRILEIEAKSDNLRQAITYLFERSGSGTRLIRRLWCATEFSPTQERSLTTSIVEKNRKHLATLKAFLETGSNQPRVALGHGVSSAFATDGL